jgi:signal transduction histidine kinase
MGWEYLSVIIILVEASSAIFNYAGAESYNFFVDEYYLLLAFLLFSAMFSSRVILVLNTILIIGASISAYLLVKDQFPAEMVKELNYGLNVYILVVIIIFIFSYLYTHTIFNAMTEIQRSAEDTEEKNFELERKTVLLKEQKAELITAKKKAEESDRLKSSFLANMSHEIRTPLNAVLGFTSLLKKSELNDSQKEFLTIIESSGNHLLELINDIIDISKLESGEVAMNQEKVNVNKLLTDVTNIFKAELISKKKNIKIITENGLRDDNVLIITDKKRLKQILINLIGNAVKFTDSGTIKVRYTSQNGKLIFDVSDTGIGISEEELPIVFNRFRQADETSTRAYGGTGLGLAISEACVKLLGGRNSS